MKQQEEKLKTTTKKIREKYFDSFSAGGGDYLKSFSFELQKWALFIAVLVFSYLFLHNIDIFHKLTIAKITTMWPTIAWRVMLVFVVGYAAIQVVRFIAVSLNKHFVSWIVIGAFIAYVLCAYFFVEDEDIRNYHRFASHDIYWILPLVILPPLSKLYGVFANWNISPIQARLNLLLFVAMVWTALEQCVTAALLYQLFIMNEKLDLQSNHVHSILVSLDVVGALAMILFYGLVIGKYRKIKRFARSLPVALFVGVPIYIGFVIWMSSAELSRTTVGAKDGIFIVICTIIAVASIGFMFFAKNELRSVKILLSIFAFAILLIWIFVFLYIVLYGLDNASYFAISLASISSAIIFIFMTFVGAKMSVIETVAFSFLLLAMIVSSTLFFMFNKMGLSSLIENNPFINPESFSLALFLLPPGLFFVVMLLRLIIAPFLINHTIGKENKIAYKAERKADRQMKKLKRKYGEDANDASSSGNKNVAENKDKAAPEAKGVQHV